MSRGQQLTLPSPCQAVPCREQPGTAALQDGAALTCARGPAGSSVSAAEKFSLLLPVKAPDIHLPLNISRADRLLINLELSLQDSAARAAAVGYRRNSSHSSSR